MEEHLLSKFESVKMLQIVNINSPLTYGEAKKITEFKTAEIIKAYKELYDIEVQENFKNIESLELYECIESGYQFYFPFTVEGKNDFYKKLSSYDWYYMPWKWEHQKSLKFAEHAKSILEIGCGDGAYLRKLGQLYPGKELRGLEITLKDTPDSLIENDTIEGYAQKHSRKFDMVCSYQVLEHISQVKTFLESSVKVLNDNGYLIISVPNNDSIFFKKKGLPYLNLPPHHMGLWNNQSLIYLEKLLPLKRIKTYYEPVQNYHFEWLKSIIKIRMRNTGIPLTYRLTSNNLIMNVIGWLLKPMTRGHSIMVVYQKK